MDTMRRPYARQKEPETAPVEPAPSAEAAKTRRQWLTAAAGAAVGGVALAVGSARPAGAALNLIDALSDQTISGVKTFTASPIAPEPTKPEQVATRGFVLANAGNVLDADATRKGKVQLAGDLGGTAAAPTVPGLALKANDNAVLKLTGAQTKTGILTLQDQVRVSAQPWLGDGLTQPSIGFAGDPNTGFGQLSGVVEDGDIAMISNGAFVAAWETTRLASGAPNTLVLNSRAANRLMFQSAGALILATSTGHMEIESADAADDYETTITGYRIGTAQSSTVVFQTDPTVAEKTPLAIHLPANATADAFVIRNNARGDACTLHCNWKPRGSQLNQAGRSEAGRFRRLPLHRIRRNLDEWALQFRKPASTLRDRHATWGGEYCPDLRERQWCREDTALCKVRQWRRSGAGDRAVKLRLLKVIVQPVFVVDDGENLTEQMSEPVVVSAVDWPRYATGAFVEAFEQLRRQVEGSPAPSSDGAPGS